MIKQLDFISESDNPHKDLADKVNEVIRAQNAMEAANTSTNRRRNEIKPCALSEYCLAYGAHECMLHLCRKFITV